MGPRNVLASNNVRGLPKVELASPLACIALYAYSIVPALAMALAGASVRVRAVDLGYTLITMLD